MIFDCISRSVGAVNNSEAILHVDICTGRINDFADEIIGIGLFAGVEAEIFEEKNGAIFELFYGRFNIGTGNIVDKSDVWNELIKGFCNWLKRERFIFAFRAAEM